MQNRIRTTAFWTAMVIAIAVPLTATAMSSQLQWRSPVYIAASFAGVIALLLILLQPILAAGIGPGLSARQSRRFHQWLGGVLTIAVVAHVAGLWITSPPDVIDALLFVSPTPFSLWGVIAMWALFIAAIVAALRRKFRLTANTWKLSHKTLVVVVVVGTVVHAMKIEGAMETLSKTALCVLVIIATLAGLLKTQAKK